MSHNIVNKIVSLIKIEKKYKFFLRTGVIIKLKNLCSDDGHPTVYPTIGYQTVSVISVYQYLSSLYVYFFKAAVNHILFKINF